MNRRIFTFFLGTILFVDLSGCAAHIENCNNNTPPTFNRSLITKRNILMNTVFAVPKRPLHVSLTPYNEQRNKNYQLYWLHFPSVGNNGQNGNYVTAYYYRSKLPGKKKLLIILPIWGSSRFPSKKITSVVTRRSKGKVNVIWILGDNRFVPWEDLENAPTKQRFLYLLNELAIRTQNTTIDLRRLIRWAVKQNDISKKHIIVAGSSIGAIMTGVLTKTEPHVTAAILLMGGANPVEMMYNCAYQPVKIRDKITRRFHWSKQKYKQILETYFGPYNMARYPTHLSPSHVLIFNSYYDECISKKSREQLWVSMKKPRRITMLYSHRKSFYAMTELGGNFINKEIYNFIKKM